MALINTSDIISGSVGDETYSRNSGGAYKKKKKTTGYTPNAYSTPINDNLVYLSQYWGQNLSLEQRNAWYAAGSNWIKKNKVGLTRTPNGYNLFIKINAQLLAIGEPIIDIPPVKCIFPVITEFRIRVNAEFQLVNVWLNPNGNIGDYRYEIWFTPPLSQGIRNYWKYKRLLYTSPSVVNYPIDLSSNYNARFGDINGDLIVFCNVVPINKKTGEKGQILSCSTISEN